MKKLIALILSLVMAAAVGVVPCIAAGAANNGVVKTGFYYLSKDPDYRIHAISWKPKCHPVCPRNGGVH